MLSTSSVSAQLPQAEVHALAHADGSTIYSFPPGYSIACVVNGPLDVSRRDELSQEMYVDVHIRPAVGVGGPAYRRLESLLHSVLTSTILVRSYPRTQLQITLQILLQPAASSTYPPSLSSAHPQGPAGLSLLPHLIHAAELALIDACIPLSTVLTATAIADPASATAPDAAPSLHVFAFAPQSRRCVFSESAGQFDMAAYNNAYAQATTICCGDSDPDVNMAVSDPENGSVPDLHAWLRRTVQSSLERQYRWKSETPNGS